MLGVKRSETILRLMMADVGLNFVLVIISQATISTDASTCRLMFA